MRHHESRCDRFSVDAQHHRILWAFLTVGRGPQLADDHMAGPEPKKSVVITNETFLRLELLPRTGIDLPADAADVERLLALRQRLRLNANPQDVIVPPRMLAESSQRESCRCRLRYPSSIPVLEPLEQIFHGRRVRLCVRLLGPGLLRWK